MGSKADEAHCAKIAEAAAAFGIETETRIGSAHKTPAHVMRILEAHEASGRPTVFVTVAGRSNALSGFTDASLSLPVIACPPPSDAFAGADLYSSIRMPSGVAPAFVLEPANAALLAAKIFGVSDAAVRDKVRAYQRAQADKIVKDDEAVSKLPGGGTR